MSELGGVRGPVESLPGSLTHPVGPATRDDPDLHLWPTTTTIDADFGDTG